MNTEASKIDWPLIRRMAEASARAYQDATVSDPFTDAQALIQLVASENIIVVSFRGSSAAKDFIQDAEVWFADMLVEEAGEVVAVHHGFLEDFTAIKADVVNQVKNFLALAPQAKIHINGHSLGGALGALCALEFARQKLPVASVITFGAPRVGNCLFRDLYNAEPCGAATLKDVTFRVVNQNDIVPRTPGLLLGYRHVGQEVFLPSFCGWQLNPSLLVKALSDAAGLYRAYSTKEDVLIRNHFIAAYQQRIQLL